ncbi:MAG: hypothetical protein E7080_02350 [Bacteroidales bacterium]|nr:hypothetical protein [Bacteroidales bacterium]
MRKMNSFKYKNVVNESIESSDKSKMIISVILFILVIVYMFLPLNVGRNILGRIEDFFFFMAAFSYMYATFINNKNIRAVVLLKLCALLFCMFGAMSLFVIVYFIK